MEKKTKMLIGAAVAVVIVVLVLLIVFVPTWHTVSDANLVYARAIPTNTNVVSLGTFDSSDAAKAAATAGGYKGFTWSPVSKGGWGIKDTTLESKHAGAGYVSGIKYSLWTKLTGGKLLKEGMSSGAAADEIVYEPLVTDAIMSSPSMAAYDSAMIRRHGMENAGKDSFSSRGSLNVVGAAYVPAAGPETFSSRNPYYGTNQAPYSVYTPV